MQTCRNRRRRRSPSPTPRQALLCPGSCPPAPAYQALEVELREGDEPGFGNAGRGERARAGRAQRGAALRGAPAPAALVCIRVQPRNDGSQERIHLQEPGVSAEPAAQHSAAQRSTAEQSMMQQRMVKQALSGRGQLKGAALRAVHGGRHARHGLASRRRMLHETSSLRGEVWVAVTVKDTGVQAHGCRDRQQRGAPHLVLPPELGSWAGGSLSCADDGPSPFASSSSVRDKLSGRSKGQHQKGSRGRSVGRRAMLSTLLCDSCIWVGSICTHFSFTDQ